MKQNDLIDMFSYIQQSEMKRDAKKVITWDDFVKLTSENFVSLDTLKLSELEKIKKRCGELDITIPQLKELVIKTSTDFNLSPEDAFEIVQNKGYIK